MNNRDKILDKIQKLLALANSSNENEAKAASARAQALLTQYNLTMVDAEATADKYGKEFVDSGRQRMPIQWKFVQSLLREFFFIEIVQTKRRMKPDINTASQEEISDYLFGRPKLEICYIMFGQPHNIEVAKYVRDFLMRAFEDSFKTYRKETGASVKAKQSYYMGLYQGLQEQLLAARQEVEQETGLVVVPDADLNDFIQDAFSNKLTTTKNSTTIRDKQAMTAGYEKGKDMSVARGLSGGSEKAAVGQTLRLGGGK